MIEAGDRLWTSNVSLLARLFQNKVMFLLKSMQIYDKPDKPLLSGQPPLSGHLMEVQGCSNETCMKHDSQPAVHRGTPFL